jgi:hypothetical protein
MSELGDLKQYLGELKLPALVVRKRTFLDISGFPYYETVVSNWYRYFLDENEDHGLGNLFLHVLTNLVFETCSKNLNFANYEIVTEVQTTNKNRIDILIRGLDQDNGKFIIIENKVYHSLNNDLLDYWHFCNGKSDNKVGIVLSLVPEKIPAQVSGKFINILHSRFISRVQTEIEKSDGNFKSPYLHDFIIAIENLNRDLTMTEEILFYYENLEKCNRIYDISEKAYQYVIHHLEIAAQKLGLSFSGRAEDYRYLVPSVDGVYYTVVFDRLFEKEKSIQIIIELYKNGLVILPEIDKGIGEHKIKQADLTYKSMEQKGVWLHYASKRYPINFDALKTLSYFIEKRIAEDFSVIMNEIMIVITKSQEGIEQY